MPASFADRNNSHNMSAPTGSDEAASRHAAQESVATARRNWLVALDLLDHVPHAESEVALHVVRGWYGTACACALQQNRPAPPRDEFFRNPDPSAIPLPGNLTAEEWRADLVRFQILAEDPPWSRHQITNLTRDRLRTHCDALGRSVRIVARAGRAPARMPAERRRMLIRLTVASAVLLATIVVARTVMREAGGEPRWRAAFFSNPELSGPAVAVARYGAIDADWGEAPPLRDVPADNFSSRWDTCLTLDDPLRVTFQLASDDGARLAIDGETIIDNWTIHPWASVDRGTILGRGTHHLRVDYFEETGEAAVRLTASVPLLTARYLSLPAEPFDAAQPCPRNPTGAP